jgi:hypothetical protein
MSPGLLSSVHESLLHFTLDVIGLNGDNHSEQKLILFNHTLHRHILNGDTHAAVSGDVAVIPWEVWGRSGVALGIRYKSIPEGYYSMQPSDAQGLRLLSEGSNSMEGSTYVEIFDFHPGRVRAAMLDSDNSERVPFMVCDGPVVVNTRYSATGEDIITNLPFVYTRQVVVAPTEDAINMSSLHWPRAWEVVVKLLSLAEDGFVQLLVRTAFISCLTAPHHLVQLPEGTSVIEVDAARIVSI